MIILINPNSTESMTTAMVTTARETAPWKRFEGWTSVDGPPAIQGRADGDLATPPLLDLVGRASDAGAEAIIIACFDDTGLFESRARAKCPVVGIGQAAYHMAALTGNRFSVVTTLDVSIPVLEENIARYGLTGQLGRVRASGVPVLDLERDPGNAASRVIAEAEVADREDNVQSIILGCGGMIDIAERSGNRVQARFIDGVRAAAHIAAAF